jgi:hypothetical protein
MLRQIVIVVCMLAGPVAAQCESPPLLASDGLNGDNFGNSVSLWQDHAIVTSIYDDGIGVDSGSAYVFEKRSGTWVQVTKLIASDTADMDRFGHSCGIFGDACIVGDRYNQDLGYGSGSAYIFERQGGVWVQTAYLVAATTEQMDALFGEACDIGDGVAVVGASVEDGPAGANQGAIHIFKKSGGTWSETQVIYASDATPNARFGEAVQMSGNRLVVGSRATVGTTFAAGEVYVFQSVGGVWTETQKLTAPVPEPAGLFGEHVAINGNTIAVSALLEDSLGTDVGSVYVFEYDGTHFVQTGKLLPDTTYAAKFGVLEISGDTIVVGAAFDAEKGTAAGAVYRYTKQGSTWKKTAKFSASDTQAGDWFGSAVSVWGTDVLISAQVAMNGIGQKSGKAYVFSELDALVPYGTGTPGTGGVTPTLTLSGCTEAGETMNLAIANGKPGALAVLFLGVAKAELPLKGCTLLTFPLLLQIGLPLGGTGSIGFPSTIPASLTVPVTFDMQAFVVDPGGPKGYSSTDATQLKLGG